MERFFQCFGFGESSFSVYWGFFESVPLWGLPKNPASTAEGIG
jgi:hypothetical protein